MSCCFSIVCRRFLMASIILMCFICSSSSDALTDYNYNLSITWRFGVNLESILGCKSLFKDGECLADSECGELLKIALTLLFGGLSFGRCTDCVILRCSSPLRFQSRNFANWFSSLLKRSESIKIFA